MPAITFEYEAIFYLKTVRSIIKLNGVVLAIHYVLALVNRLDKAHSIWAMVCIACDLTGTAPV